MDLSAIIVIVVLTALSLAALVWMERSSRMRQLEGAAEEERDSTQTRSDSFR